jgi:hypothetical protein
MSLMRTTINIDDDVLEKLRAEAKRARVPLRAILNPILRLGLERARPQERRPRYRCKTYSMGFPPTPNLDKALQLAALLEDEETIHELALCR